MNLRMILRSINVSLFLLFRVLHVTTNLGKCIDYRTATGGVLLKKMFLKISQNSVENTCARVFFLIKLQAACNFIKTETLAQVFSREFCENFKSTFFTEHHRATASVTTW